jgi:heptosyltransferase-2/heptosyltransferase-3
VARLRASLWGTAPGPHVAIHPISGAEGKQWPLARFAGLADRLHDDLGAAVVFLAAPSERPQLQTLEALCTRPHRFETSLRLGDVSGAIKAAHLFIGNDSGLAHIAAGVGTPEVVIWGGSNLAMARPVTPPGLSQVLYRDVPCRATCAEVVCTSPDRLRCLTDISESDVLDAARALLASTQAVAVGAVSH